LERVGGFARCGQGAATRADGGEEEWALLASEQSGSGTSGEIAAEQRQVTRLYARLDTLRERTAARLREVLASPVAGHSGLLERDIDARLQSERLAALEAAEAGLVIGRIDSREATGPLYVGRVGLSGESDDGGRLLVDWRAPAARPFYVATPAHDLGVVRRRHIRTSLRKVVGVSDEVLDVLTAAETPGTTLTGEAALMAALGAARTGRMTDIVRTIQAEQDAIIRADARGVLVVQGGPGTGKTAVALHRAAYLLYTHRERLFRSGVLIVGPSPAFLRYIADVLPSLGETGVLLAGLGQLRPGLDARGVEPPAAAEVKGRPAMVDVLKAAVRDREAVPSGPVEVIVDGTPLQFTPRDGGRARKAARSSSRLHNLGRPAFAASVIGTLTRRYAEHLGRGIEGAGDLLDRGDIAALRQEVASTPAVRALIDRLWPRLTPERLLTELYASPARIAAATPGWSDDDRALLHRAPSPWTPADVPLLEEADELLGTDDSASRARARRKRSRDLARAQETLDLLHGSRSTDLEEGEAAEELTAGDVLDAAALAERHSEVDLRTTAERAAADRTWTFGHVVVDEAQELSPMAWRLVLRKCPTRSMTIVGDVAQTGSLAGASSWAEALEPQLGTGWRRAELTVNYRTPAEIMAVAADVLAASGSGEQAPRSVRSTGERPYAAVVDEGDLSGEVADVVEKFAAEEGTVAVVAPAGRVPALAAALAERVPSVQWGAAGDPSRGPLVAAPAEVKGLEFDSVVVVDPAGILEAAVRGTSDLYVALTRATQRLRVVSPGPLPATLSRLA
jgi:DNA helicase IV